MDLEAFDPGREQGSEVPPIIGGHAWLIAEYGCFSSSDRVIEVQHTQDELLRKKDSKLRIIGGLGMRIVGWVWLVPGRAGPL